MAEALLVDKNKARKVATLRTAGAAKRERERFFFPF